MEPGAGRTGAARGHASRECTRGGGRGQEPDPRHRVPARLQIGPEHGQPAPAAYGAEVRVQGSALRCADAQRGRAGRRALSGRQPGLPVPARRRVPPYGLEHKEMSMLAVTLILLVALLHLYFLVLEMFLWTRPAGLKVFRTTPEKAELPQNGRASCRERGGRDG